MSYCSVNCVLIRVKRMEGYVAELPQQHVKDPGRSAKSAGGRLQLNTHTNYVCDFA